MMEAIPIRRERYALLREDHLSFYNRVSVLLSAEELGGDEGIGKLIGPSDFQRLESHGCRLADRSLEYFHLQRTIRKIGKARQAPG